VKKLIGNYYCLNEGGMKSYSFHMGEIRHRNGLKKELINKLILK
jgi:hypothetical protein